MPATTVAISTVRCHVFGNASINCLHNFAWKKSGTLSKFSVLGISGLKRNFRLSSSCCTPSLKDFMSNIEIVKLIEVGKIPDNEDQILRKVIKYTSITTSLTSLPVF